MVPQKLHHVMDKILEKYVFFATHLGNFSETENYIIEHYAKNLTVLQQKVRSRSSRTVLPKAGKRRHGFKRFYHISYFILNRECRLHLTLSLIFFGHQS